VTASASGQAALQRFSQRFFGNHLLECQSATGTLLQLAELVSEPNLDPIRAYIDSQNHVEQMAANAKRRIAVVLQVAAARQRNSLEVMYSNLNIGMPMSVGTDRPTADGSQWPTAETAEQLQLALAQWHTARQQMLQAWNSIRPADRSSLKAPTSATPAASMIPKPS
jgi:hypothetical protein